MPRKSVSTTPEALLLGLQSDVKSLTKSMLVIAKKVKSLEQSDPRVIRGFNCAESGREIDCAESVESIEDEGNVVA